MTHQYQKADASLKSARLLESVVRLNRAAPFELRKRERFVSQKISLLDRDQSILAFNERVLDCAMQPRIPLLERLRYLCIVSSNLDEFFEVRAAALMLAARGELAATASSAMTAYQALSAAAQELVARQYQHYNEVLLPAFEHHGVHIVSHGERNASQRRWVRDYFNREVRPLLVPIGLDPSHPFPSVANKSLNFIVRLGGKDAFGRANEIAIIKVPRVLPRFIQMHQAADKKSRKSSFVSLSSIIRAHLTDLFPGRQLLGFSQFRVTRHSDLAVDEEDVQNLRTALRAGLAQRHYGKAVRLEVSAGCPEDLSKFLMQQFELPSAALFRVHGPVNLVRLGQLVDLVNDPALLFEPHAPAYPLALQGAASVLTRMQQGDVLIHQPFESFDGVLAFLREAVSDPQVLAIRQTIYRTGAESELMALLREAVRRGKEVTVVLELKARFDEEANINWAEMLESIGAQVVYGVQGLKTHAKMLLVTRREGRQLKRYAHLSTGNYNPRTARLYTDLSYLTACPQITQDIENVFFHLASQSRLPRLKQLLLAPFHLHRKLVDHITVLTRAAQRGAGARIIAKMNALTDEGLIRALIDAGRAGVKIDLIVRGACMLPAQRPGLTDNIRVRSVVGRFLEHSRVFYFRMGEAETLYLSSADWMNRNMFGRIELAWPVTDAALRQRVVDECLVPYLHDDVDAWDLQSDGRYARAQAALQDASGTAMAPPKSAQAALMALYRPATVPLKVR